jgi:hypothetical protein
MRKLTTIFLAGLLLTVSMLFVSGTVGSAQKQEPENPPGDLSIDSPNTVFVTSVLAGRMLGDNNQPVSGVWLDCIGPSGSTTGFVTGADGIYRFNVSQTGHYTIRPHVGDGVTDPGFSPRQLDFYVIIPGADFHR